jgi:hypothetical protein
MSANCLLKADIGGHTYIKELFTKTECPSANCLLKADNWRTYKK